LERVAEGRIIGAAIQVWRCRRLHANNAVSTSEEFRENKRVLRRERICVPS
jgi:hypothetical protein